MDSFIVIKFNYEGGFKFFIANNEEHAEEIREKEGGIGDDFYNMDVTEAEDIVKQLSSIIENLKEPQ